MLENVWLQRTGFVATGEQHASGEPDGAVWVVWRCRTCEETAYTSSQDYPPSDVLHARGCPHRLPHP